MMALDWKDRGGDVLYTLFENGNRQPPSSEDLLRWEEDARFQFGEVPFRVLGDVGRVLVNGAGGGALPIAWVVDDQMVIEEYSKGSGTTIVINAMERLLQ